MGVNHNEKYKELFLSVEQLGLFKKRYKFYLDQIFLLLLGVLLSIYLITLTDNLVIQIFNGIFLAILFMQIGFIGHDAAHGQVFKSRLKNKILGMFCMGLVLGISERHWYKQHNEHHKEVNHEGHDPDLDVPFIFDKKQSVEGFSFFQMFILRYQHILFFISLPIWGIRKLYTVFKDNILDFSINGFVDAAITIIHFTILSYLLFSYLSLYTIIFFLIAHLVTAGIYMGVSFAPNHKGEDMTSYDEEIQWYHQITNTRNIYMNKFSFYATGGLNLQIEHHLFPNMPRPNYVLTQPIVKDFCKRNNLEYTEMSFVDSMKEIYKSLKENSVRLQ